MPAFTFEKISPPVRPNAPPPEIEPKQQRGVIIRMLDRFVESRVRRAVPEGDAHHQFRKTPE
jgi:hypothetical protein